MAGQRWFVASMRRTYDDVTYLMMMSYDDVTCHMQVRGVNVPNDKRKEEKERARASEQEGGREGRREGRREGGAY